MQSPQEAFYPGQGGLWNFKRLQLVSLKTTSVFVFVLVWDALSAGGTFPSVLLVPSKAQGLWAAVKALWTKGGALSPVISGRGCRLATATWTWPPRVHQVPVLSCSNQEISPRNADSQLPGPILPWPTASGQGQLYPCARSSVQHLNSLQIIYGGNIHTT